MEQFLKDLNPAVLALIRVVLFVVPILLIVPGCIWWERRLLSWMQDRIGPNRTGTYTTKSGKRIGTFGLLQPIADGVKLFLKEDITPTSIDRFLYFVAPAVALFPAFALGGTIPWGPDYGVYGLLTPIWNAEIGILYMLAISSLGVYGVVLAGYASNNKYSLLGGLRASAQLISYELAMSVALASVVMASGSLKMTEIVKAQEGPWMGIGSLVQNWFIFTPYGFIAAVIFGICVVAETNRAPFDLPEAENEIIAGYHTEYSSMKFAVFFMGEYAAMFVFGGVFGTVFLGGYNMLPIRWEILPLMHFSGPLLGMESALEAIKPGIRSFVALMMNINYWLAPIIFLSKCVLGMTIFIWIRGTLPRLRYDHLMALGWKVLLPAAVGNFIVVACSIMAKKMYTNGAPISFAVALLIAVPFYIALNKGVKKGETSMERRELDMEDGTDAVPSRRSIELV